MTNSDLPLSKRLKKVRKDNGLTQEEFSAAIGIKPVSLSNYERGAQNPGIGRLFVVADKFNVNLDWLIRGIGEPYKETPEFLIANPETVETRVKKLREELGLKQREMADMLGVTAQLVGGWDCGRIKITYKRVKQIVDKLGVSEDWLLTGAGEMFVPKENLKLEDAPSDKIGTETCLRIFDSLSEHDKKLTFKVIQKIMAELDEK